MGLNEVDKYVCKDTELQNYTKTGVKRILEMGSVGQNSRMQQHGCSQIPPGPGDGVK